MAVGLGARPSRLSASPTITSFTGLAPAGVASAITITGSGFTSTTAVLFGSTPAANFTITSGTQLSVTTPVLSAGTSVVTVQTSNGNATSNSSITFYNFTLGTTAASEGPAAGTDTVVLGVTNAAAASWTASAAALWLHIASGSTSGSGNALITFTFDQNSGATRTGSLTIAGITFTVTQAGSTYVAGSASGTVASIGTGISYGVTTDGAGNVYFGDSTNNQIKKWTPSTGSVSVVKTTGRGPPGGIAADSAGDVFFVLPISSSVSEVSASSTLTTLFLDSFLLNNPLAVSLDGILYYGSGSTIKQLSPSTGTSTLISSGLTTPASVAVDAADNLYIADSSLRTIQKWTATTAQLSTQITTSSTAGIAVDGAGNIYYANGTSGVQEWSVVTHQSTPVLTVSFLNPGAIAVDASGNVYVADSTVLNTVFGAVRGYVDPTTKSETGASGTDTLPVVIPSTTYLRAPFAPTSDQTWLTIGSTTNGVVGFSFTANTGAARTAHITVLGQSITVNQGAAAPAITGVSGSSTISGGRAIAITGTGFSGVTAVSFGGVPATSFSVVSATQITAIAPAGSAGSVDITVTAPGGTSPTVTADRFTYSNALLAVNARLEGPASGSDSVLLSAGAAWTAVSNNFWLQVAAGNASGSTNALIAFTFDANPGATRTGTITIGGLIFTVTQAGGTYAKVSSPTALVPSGFSNYPNGVAIDGSGNVYIAETNNNVVKEWVASSQQVITLIPSSSLASPSSVAVDAFGNLYITDQRGLEKWSVNTQQVTNLYSAFLSGASVAVDSAGNAYVVTPATGSLVEWSSSTQQVTTLVSTGLSAPSGVAVDAIGNVYIADTGNTALKLWSPTTQLVTTLVSTGLNAPVSLAVDGGGNVYLADSLQNSIKEWVASTQQVTTLLSSGLSSPKGVASDALGNLAIADTNNDSAKQLLLAYFDSTANSTILAQVVTSPQAPPAPSISAVTGPGFAQGGTAVTITGTGLSGVTAVNFGGTAALSFVVTSDTQISALAPAGSAGTVDVTVTAPAGTSPITTADEFTYVSFALGVLSRLEGPTAGADAVILLASAAWTATANVSWLHVASGSASGATNASVQFTYDANSGATRTGTLTIGGLTFTVTQAGSPYVRLGTATTLVNSSSSTAYGAAMDASGNVYFSNQTDGTVRVWTASTQQVTTLVSSGLVSSPYGVAVDAGGNVYVAGSGDNTVKKWSAGTRQVTTLVPAGLASPSGVAVDGVGNVYIADNGHNSVKVWSAGTQQVTTLVSTGLASPVGVAADAAGNVYIADSGNQAIKLWSASTHQVTTLVSTAPNAPSAVAVDAAGNVTFAEAGAGAIVEWFAATQQVQTLISSGLSTPQGLASDAFGNLAIADTGNSAIKELPLVYLNPTAVTEARGAGSDTLPVILPSTQSLTGVFAPSSDQSWLTIGTVTGGTVGFSFTANTGGTQTGHLTLLGQKITVTQLGLQPIVTGVSGFSSTAGGSSATISGTSFTGVTSVSFGGVPATSFTLISSTLITAIAPATTAAGSVSITVTTPGGTSPSTTLSQFTYFAYTLGSNAWVEGPGAASDTVVLGVTGGVAAAWTASANVTWLHIATGSASGAGNATILFNIDANTGVTRTGTLTIAGLTYSVTQAASAYVAANPLTSLVSPAGSLGGIGVDGSGNIYYVNIGNGGLYEITPSQLASGGSLGTQVYPLPATTAIGGVALDASGNRYFSVPGSNSVMELAAGASSTSSVTLVSVDLSGPSGVAVDTYGNVYIADTGNNAIKEWVAATQQVSTLISSSLSRPTGIAVDAGGNVYVADAGNGAIKKWSVATQQVTTLTSVSAPLSVAVDGAGNVYFGTGTTVQEWVAATQQVVTVAGSGLGSVSGVAVDASGNLFIEESQPNFLHELPRAFVNPTSRAESLSGGTDALPTVLPSTETLAGPFAPTSDSAWVTIQSVTSGIVNFQFGANTSSARTAHLVVLGQSIAISEATAVAAVTGVTVPASGVYQAGSALSVTVNFSSPVTVAGTPTLLLSVGSASRTANYVSGTGSTALVFSYTLQASDIAGGVGLFPPIQFPSGASITTANSGVAASVAFTAPSTSGISFVTTPVISWPTPSPITYGTPLSATQLSATATTNFGEAISGTFTYSLATGTVLNAGSQALSVTFTPAQTTLYNSATAQVTLVVNQATPTISWARPAAITYGAPLSSTQLNAVASLGGNPAVSGTYTYTPAAGSLIPVGSDTLSVVFTPGTSDAVNYTTASAATTILVNPLITVITWNTPAAIAYGTPLSATQFNATANVAGSFAYSPAVGTVLSAGGGQLLTAVFTDLNGTATTAQVRIAVNQVTPVVTWPTPAPIAFGSVLTATQLNATTTIPGTFAYSPPASTALPIGDQALTVTFIPTDTRDYTLGSASVTLTVRGSPTLTWPTPAPITYGTLLSGAQLNATANVPGTFAYAPSAGSKLGAGPQSLAVSFTPTDTVHYSTATAVVGLKINQAPSIISWSNLAPMAFGTPLSAAQLNATAEDSNGKPIAGTFSYTPGPGTVLSAGTQSLSVTFTPNDPNDPTVSTSYATASANASVVVSSGNAFLSWPSPSPIGYGTALSGAQLNATANIAGSISYSPAAGTVLTAGSRVLTATFTPRDSVNFPTISASVTLTVSQVAPAITWNPTRAITYGTPLSAVQLNATITAANAPTPAGTFTYSPALGTVLQAGSKILTVTFTPSDTLDYASVSTSVPLTVNQAIPNVVWNSPAPITYGTVLTVAQLNASAVDANNAVIAGSFAYSPGFGALLGAGTQPLTATFTPVDTTNFKPASGKVSVTVNPAATTFTWSTPVAITYGTPLTGTQLNASTPVANGNSVAGSFSYNFASGTVLRAGNQTLIATFTPTDATDYLPSTIRAVLSVKQAVPALTWTPASLVFPAGLSAAQFNASAVDGNQVSIPGTYAYAGTGNTPLQNGYLFRVGSQSATVAFTPTDTVDYTSATLSTTITVTQGTPTLAWATPKSIPYSTRLSIAQLNAAATDSTGASVQGHYTYSPSIDAVLTIGLNTLNVSFVPSDQADYTPATAQTTLMVTAMTPRLFWVPFPGGAIPYGTPLTQADYYVDNADAIGGSIPGTYSYSPPIGAILHGGTNPLTVVFTPQDSVDFVTATITNTLVVSPQVPSIIWTPQPLSYGTALSAAQLNALATDNTGNAVPGTYAYSPNFGSVPNTGSQTLSVTFTPSDALSFSSVTRTATVVVTPVPVKLTWTNPPPITFSTALSSAQLNAVAVGANNATVPGNYTYTPAAGSLLRVGSNPATVSFQATDSVNYPGVATASTTITVTPLTPTIQWNPAPLSYGSAFSASQLNATAVDLNGAKVGGTFTYSPVSLAGSSPGMYSITANFTPGDSADVRPASVSTILTVNQSVPTITWNPAPLPYSAKVSSAQTNATAATATGQTIAGVFTYDTSQVGADAGSYPASVTFKPTDSVDFATTTLKGTLVIVPADQTIPFPVSSGQIGIPIGLSATTTAGLSILYSLVTGDATLVYNVLTLVDWLPVQILATQSGNADYNPVAATLTVNNLTPEPTSIVWYDPDPIFYGTALDATQLNAVASDTSGNAVSGTYTYSPDFGTVPHGGSHVLSVTFTPTDSVHYLSSTATANLVVQPIGQTITFTPPGKVTTGTAIALSSTASSGLPITYSLPYSPRGSLDTLIGSTLTLYDLQAVEVFVTQAGNADYQPAQLIEVLQAGSKKNQTVTFPQIPTHYTNETSIRLNATSDSGLPLTFTVDQDSLQFVTVSPSGNYLFPTGVSGWVNVTASNAGNSTWNAVTISQTFPISPASFSVSLGSTSSGKGLALGKGGDLSAAVSTANIAATFSAAEHSGTLIGYLPSLSQGFVATIATAADGGFTASTTTIGGPGPYTALTISGKATANGVSGTIQPLGLAFSTTADSAIGSTSKISGQYSAANLNPSGGTTYSVVGSQGEVFVLAVSPTTVASGTGTVSPTNGSFSVQTTQSTTITGAVSASSKSVSGTVTTAAGGTVAFAGSSQSVSTTGALINLSSLGMVTPSSPLIVGFVIDGTDSKTVVLRGIGPALTAFGVQNPLNSPLLTLYDSSGNALATNQGWGGSTDLANAFSQVFAFALPTSSADSALETTLAPGLYSAVISDPIYDGGGRAMAEIYDASVDPTETTQSLVNISSRGQVTASTPVTAGFVVQGNTPKRLLIRAVGPALAAFGVPGVLTKPNLSVYTAAQTLVAQNQAWGTPVSVPSGQTPANAASLSAASATAGAFPLASGSNDSALITVLASGNYSAVATGANGSVGTVLIEVYELPPQ